MIKRSLVFENDALLARDNSLLQPPIALGHFSESVPLREYVGFAIPNLKRGR